MPTRIQVLLTSLREDLAAISRSTRTESAKHSDRLHAAQHLLKALGVAKPREWRDWTGNPAVWFESLLTLDDDAAVAAIRAATREPGKVPVHVLGVDPHPPSPREWVVRDWLPADRVALLVGPGGVGKSRLCLQLAASVAKGRPWIAGGDLGDLRPDHAFAGSTVVVASWEDEPVQLERVLHGGIVDDVARLDGGVKMLDMAGAGPMWAPDPVDRVGHLLPAGEWARAYCERVGARLLVIDTLAAAYADSENDRARVWHFVSDWDAWAVRSSCAVMLVAQPSKAGSVYSSSTDWIGAVRTAWTLGRDTADKGAATRLRVLKSNYAAKPEAMSLVGWPRWRRVC